MKTLLPTLFAGALATGIAVAQAQDVGLTMDGGFLTVIYGQECGPVGCAPFAAGPIGVGSSRNLMHTGAPQTLFAIAIGLPGPCLAVPGIDNPLLLADPVVLDWGLTSAPPFVPLPCQQGVAGATLVIPAGAPTGITVRLQSFGVSGSGAFAFGPAIETTTV